MTLKSPITTAKRWYDKGGLGGLTRSIVDFCYSQFVRPILVELWDRRLQRNGYRTRYNGIELDLSSSELTDANRLKFVSPHWGAGHETEERTLLLRHLPTDLPVVELGAGIGYISCVTDQKLESGTAHVVVEANPNLISTLERNREFNGAAYSVVPAAYSPEAEETSFYTTSFVNASTKQDRAVGSTGTADEFEEHTVEATSLESLLESEGLTECSLLVDIEGDETELILEETETLATSCRFLLIEYHYEAVGEEVIAKLKQTLFDTGFRELSSQRPSTQVEVCVYENV